MRKSLLPLSVLIVALAGCKTHPKIDYTALDQSGMWSTSLAQLKKMNVSNAEVGELTKLKRAGASDALRSRVRGVDRPGQGTANVRDRCGLGPGQGLGLHHRRGRRIQL